MGCSELLAVTASTSHSVRNGRVCGSHQAEQMAKNPVPCAQPRHARLPFLMCSASSFPGPLKVLIHVTYSSPLDHSTYLSDDQWHHPERYSCLSQNLCRGLPKLFWGCQACTNHSLASCPLHHVSSLCPGHSLPLLRSSLFSLPGTPPCHLSSSIPGI